MKEIASFLLTRMSRILETFHVEENLKNVMMWPYRYADEQRGRRRGGARNPQLVLMFL
jgi:hypothetical protein